METRRELAGRESIPSPSTIALIPIAVVMFAGEHREVARGKQVRACGDGAWACSAPADLRISPQSFAGPTCRGAWGVAADGEGDFTQMAESRLMGYAAAEARCLRLP